MAELTGLDPSWEGFFGESTELKLDQWSIEGESGKLDKDLMVR
jgi:hypothetical protein